MNRLMKELRSLEGKKHNEKASKIGHQALLLFSKTHPVLQFSDY